MAGKRFYSKVCLMVCLLTCSAFACYDGFYGCTEDRAGFGVIQTPTTGFSNPSFSLLHTNDMYVEDYTNISKRSWKTLLTDATTDNNASFYVSPCLSKDSTCGTAHSGTFSSQASKVLVKDSNNFFREIGLTTQNPPGCSSGCEFSPLKFTGISPTSVGLLADATHSYSHWAEADATHDNYLMESAKDKLNLVVWASADLTSWSRTLFYDFATCSQLPSPGVSYRNGTLHGTSDDTMWAYAISKRSGDTQASQYVAVYVGGGCRILQTDTGAVSGGPPLWGAGTVTSTSRFLVKEAELQPYGGINGGAVIVMTVASCISGPCSTTQKEVWYVDSLTMTDCVTNCSGPRTKSRDDNAGYKRLLTKAGTNTLYTHDVTNLGGTPTVFFKNQAGTRSYNFGDCDVTATSYCQTASPVFTTTFQANGTWTHPYENEFFLFFQGADLNVSPGAAQGMGHTMGSGTNPITECKQTQFAVFGAFAIWTTDDLGLWGTDNKGNPQCRIVGVIMP